MLYLDVVFSDYPLVARGSMASMNNHLDLSSLSESEIDDGSLKRGDTGGALYPAEETSQNERLLSQEDTVELHSANNNNNVTSQPRVEPCRAVNGRYRRFGDIKSSGDYDNVNEIWPPPTSLSVSPINGYANSQRSVATKRYMEKSTVRGVQLIVKATDVARCS